MLRSNKNVLIFRDIIYVYEYDYLTDVQPGTDSSVERSAAAM